MRDSTLSSVGRVSAVVLAVLALTAAVNTVIIGVYAVDRGQLLGGAGAGVLAGLGISVALGYAAVRRWRRAS